ncbi:unnamed protein product [Rhizophagus irregularis]|uniref:Uncharacterized protein n=1 Tax=Rhizophagus irregularis TaxID=588596 RepID=A0A915ZCJ6_9GLOM|nr:unnamed protein product [Rhizophagus irregularis]CAB5371532.1 unnamed protein product [Rhizophagus irregularis]
MTNIDLSATAFYEGGPLVQIVKKYWNLDLLTIYVGAFLKGTSNVANKYYCRVDIPIIWGDPLHQIIINKHLYIVLRYKKGSPKAIE